MAAVTVLLHDLRYSDLQKYMIHKTTNSISLKGPAEQLTHGEPLLLYLIASELYALRVFGKEFFHYQGKTHTFIFVPSSLRKH